VIAPDVVMRIREVQLKRKLDKGNPAVETTALAVYHATGSIDACRVGFL